MAAARSRAASGAGDSFPRLATALATMPLRSPSLAARSNRTVSTFALTRCAAICAPMTPAPSTATRRIGRRGEVMRGSFLQAWRPPRDPRGGRVRWRILRRGAEPGRREADEFLGGVAPVLVLGTSGRPLDHAELAHRIGEGAGDEVEAPVQRFLVELGHELLDRARERLQHVAVVVREELAQAHVVLGV